MPGHSWALFMLSGMPPPSDNTSGHRTLPMISDLPKQAVSTHPDAGGHDMGPGPAGSISCSGS